VHSNASAYCIVYFWLIALHHNLYYWYAVVLFFFVGIVMDKSAYLDAMGITRWRSGHDEPKPFLVLHDEDFVPIFNKQPLLAEVLFLLNVKPEECQFDTELVKGCQLVWDMRSQKTRPRTAWINSEPFAALLTPEASHKRALWQQICAYLDMAK
jgi:DNA polymerase III psi subunit